jgi:hypothetical protein
MIGTAKKENNRTIKAMNMQKGRRKEKQDDEKKVRDFILVLFCALGVRWRFCSEQRFAIIIVRICREEVP